MPARNISLAAIGFVVTSLLTGCDAPVSPGPTAEQSSVLRKSDAGLKQRQADFLNRIREADPAHRTIERALLNEQNELGLILGRTVEMDKIPDLMRTILTQMAREFPGQDLTVLAYGPASPPRKIGTAHLNAHTHDISYAPAQ